MGGALAACLSLVVIHLAFPLWNSTPSSPANRPISAYIQEDVSSVTAIYTAEGNTVERLIEGAELDRLRTWTNDLHYILIADSGKEPPSDAEIKETYEFVITEGDYPGYSYIITEFGDSFLLIDFDPNPSKPPIDISSAKEGDKLPGKDNPSAEYTDNISGTIKFYYEPTKEFTEPVGEGITSLSSNHGEAYKIISQFAFVFLAE